MNVIQIPDDSKLVDCYQQLDAHAYAILKQLGYLAAGRYVDDLTTGEIKAAHGEGMGIFLIKTCRRGGWIPSKLYAEQDATYVKRRFETLQLPDEAIKTFWLDDESPGGTAQDEIDYLNRAYEWLFPELGGPGVYVGFGTRMSATELYWRLKLKRYYKSGSHVPEVAERGYCLRQQYPLDVKFPELPGHQFDIDIAKTDLKGGQAMMLVGDNMSVA